MKKPILAKYANITYPIFLLRNKPVDIKYSTHTIECRVSSSSSYAILDDKRLPGDYLARLSQISNRLLFDFTSRDLSSLLLSEAAWGIDATTRIFNFNRTHKAILERRKIVSAKNNLIWLKNISYPFKLSTQENIRLDLDVYATVTNINNEWHLLGFTYENDLERPYILV
jgi:hypothetical protein